MNNKFTVGFLAGAAAALAVVATGLLTVKKTMIDPIEAHEAWIEDNKKKANRKSLGHS